MGGSGFNTHLIWSRTICSFYLSCAFDVHQDTLTFGIGFVVLSTPSIFFISSGISFLDLKVKSKIVGEIKFIRFLSVRISAVLYLKAAVFWNVLWQVCISATCSLQISCWPWIINMSKCTLHNTHDFQRSFLRHKMQKQSRYKMIITRQGSKWLTMALGGQPEIAFSDQYLSWFKSAHFCMS